jgi:anthranilate phosphoribosyltransferase
MLPAKDTTTPEERLRAFGEIVGRLIRKEDISRAEARECWRQICAGEQPEMQQGAFIAALAAKPETLEEVAGTFDALTNTTRPRSRSTLRNHSSTMQGPAAIR